MKKTKLFTSIAALALVLGLGACETTSEEETTSDESESTSQSSETTPSTETNPDGYVLVGDFTDSNWDAKVSEDSKYYIPLGTTEYKQTVTIAAEPDYGEYDPWDAGLRVVEWGDSWNLVVGSDELDEASTGVTGSDSSKNIKVNWGETYDITITFGDTNSILVTLQEEGGNEGETEVFSGTYKLGALDEGNYCYRYFNGGTSSSKLTTTDNWEEAVDVTIELDETALETLDDDEEELTGTPYTLSFTNSDGDTKYISWSSSTNVDLSDTAYTWYWVDSIECFAAGAVNGRVLVYYAASSDIRAYAQSDTNLAYPHVYPYTEAQENPEAPEVTTTYEQVSDLGDGGQFYAGGYSSSTLYLTTGSISGYNFPTSQDLDSCVPFTVTGNATDGYTLTCSDGKYVYAYDTGSYYDFGTSDAATVPDSGTNIFYWNDDASTLYCNGSDVRTTARYTYVYFEFYGGNVCTYGTNALNASTSNLAHFYQQVTA